MQGLTTGASASSGARTMGCPTFNTSIWAYCVPYHVLSLRGLENLAPASGPLLRLLPLLGPLFFSCPHGIPLAIFQNPPDKSHRCSSELVWHESPVDENPLDTWKCCAFRCCLCQAGHPDCLPPVQTDFLRAVSVCLYHATLSPICLPS